VVNDWLKPSKPPAQNDQLKTTGSITLL